MERRASCVMPLLLSLQAVAGIALYTAPNAYAASHAVGQPAAPIYTAAALRHRAGALRCCEASDASAICAGSHIVTAISGDGSISAKAVVTTDTVEEVRRLQGLEGLACAALGRALSCSMLIAEGLKESKAPLQYIDLRSNSISSEAESALREAAKAIPSLTLRL